MDLKKTVISLCSLMSISGHERYDDKKLDLLTKDIFDEYYTDNIGNHVLVKRCGKLGAAKILVDTHFDEIGMIVTDILEGGFLRVTNIGGVDTRILSGSLVNIYGEGRVITGIVSSEHPSMMTFDNSKKLKHITELFVDTGIGKECLERFVSLGTPVGFYPDNIELMENKLVGKGFDNKACCAAALTAVAEAERNELAGDVYLLFSSFEETSFKGGVSPAVYSIDPDYAISADVNLGRTPDTKPKDTVKMGDGASITLSAVTDRRLTELTRQISDELGIKYQMCVSPVSTGTNAGPINIVKNGVPVVDIGVPLKNMHTGSEVLDLEDLKSMKKIIKAFICSERIAEVFGK